MLDRSYGPHPATHTGLCPVCGNRRKIDPSDGRLVRHGSYPSRCYNRRWEPVAGSLLPVQQSPRRYLYQEHLDRARGADEVMGRAYDELVQAAQHLTTDHPATESVGRAIDTLAGWLGRRTVIIGRGDA